MKVRYGNLIYKFAFTLLSNSIEKFSSFFINCFISKNPALKQDFIRKNTIRIN